MDACKSIGMIPQSEK